MMKLLARATHPYNDHVVYISGPHGSGKSTLVKQLNETMPELEIQEQLAHLESLEDMVERAIWRTALHAIEHRINLSKAEKNPNQIIIGDRCYLDDYVYWSAFSRLGWITKRQLKQFIGMAEQTYKSTNTPKPTRIILLCPPYEWNVGRVKQRWEEGEHVKWHEDNFSYLRHVNDEFHREAIHARKGTLVMKDTDLDVRVSRIRNWINGETAPGKALVEAGRQTYRNLGGSD